MIAKLLDERLHQLGDLRALLIALVDRYDHHIDRCQRGRQHQTIVIGVGHDKGTHQSGRYAPRSGPYQLLLTILVGKGDVKGLGKVLSQEV